MTRLAVATAGGPNVCAFLDMIAHSEIGSALLAQSDDGYNVLVGSTASKPLTFPSYAAHPEILNHALNSTAAGRYQIIRGTWAGISGQLGLHDFSPENQDRAAIGLIDGRKALDAVKAGEIENAIGLCAQEWASLPGAGYGQHENKMADLLSAYNTARAKYAGTNDTKPAPSAPQKSFLAMLIEAILGLFK